MKFSSLLNITAITLTFFSLAPQCRALDTAIPTDCDMPEAAPNHTPDNTVQTKLTQAGQLFRGYYYDEALAILDTIPKLSDGVTSDPRAIGGANQIVRARQSLIPYKGPAHHVFFHSLIVYPQLAFDNVGHSAAGYNMWMTTVPEFQAILPKLMERGYVLVNLTDFIEPDPTSSGLVRRRDILLPPGKTPLVLSVDDVNYYRYMKTDGFANRLVLGDDGRVWTEVITPDKETTRTRNGDVIPILDDFVTSCPEFSWRGAKGVLALTGYEGAMGYRILPENTPEENDAATSAAKAVADTLKKNGWLFASHSYTHNQYFQNGKLTMENLEYDTTRWKQLIQPVTGPTNIYITPFGAEGMYQNGFGDYLIGQGYNIFCPVGEVAPAEIRKDRRALIMHRTNLDGYKMTYAKPLLNKYYFNPDEILDPVRPPVLRLAPEPTSSNMTTPTNEQKPRKSRGFFFQNWFK